MDPTDDPYTRLAARYDRMRRERPERSAFLRALFERHGVQSVLDCACGTGRDLVTFRDMGFDVAGSDRSEAMLARARAWLAAEGAEVPLRQADFRDLAEHGDARFDAVVCLGNSINELLDDADVHRALRSMRAVLRPGGVLVLDQGQTDASMKSPPAYAPVVNDEDFTRLLVMAYERDLMTVHVLDFVHTAVTTDLSETTLRLRVRLQADWQRLLAGAGFSAVEMYGDWSGRSYDVDGAERLIATAVA